MSSVCDKGHAPYNLRRQIKQLIYLIKTVVIKTKRILSILTMLTRHIFVLCFKNKSYSVVFTSLSNNSIRDPVPYLSQGYNRKPILQGKTHLRGYAQLKLID